LRVIVAVSVPGRPAVQSPQHCLSTLPGSSFDDTLGSRHAHVPLYALPCGIPDASFSIEQFHASPDGRVLAFFTIESKQLPGHLSSVWSSSRWIETAPS